LFESSQSLKYDCDRYERAISNHIQLLFQNSDICMNYCVPSLPDSLIEFYFYYTTITIWAIAILRLTKRYLIQHASFTTLSMNKFCLFR
jgi:hypothetical protein